MKHSDRLIKWKQIIRILFKNNTHAFRIVLGTEHNFRSGFPKNNNEETIIVSNVVV